MTATLIKTARSLKVYHETERIFCKETTSTSVHTQERFYWSNAVTWCVTWKITKLKGRRADRGLWREENGTICLHSNVIRIGEEHTTKNPKRKMWKQPAKKTSKQTNEQTSRGSSRSLGSWQRWDTQSQGLRGSPFQTFRLKSAGEKIDDEKKKTGDLACEASVSVRFRSKERGTRVKNRAKILPQMLATQARGDLRRGNYSHQCPLFSPLFFPAYDLTCSPPSELRALLSEHL